MDLRYLLPNFDYTVERISIDTQQVMQISIRPGKAEGKCPCCGQDSQRVHSYYERCVQDMPCSGRSVELRVKVRRFFCGNTGCARRIFTERLPDLVAPHARRTERLGQVMQRIGLLVGGSAAVQIVRCWPIRTSRWTILRTVRAVKALPSQTPRVLGVDDWAMRRGHRYGTILVNLEAAQVIDLLPDREADTLAGWLQTHPGVEIISRDRAGAYAEGARRGAPQAIQVADRWHLFKNLGEALTTLLGRHRRALKQIHTTADPVTLPENEARSEMPLRSATAQRRYERFEQVRHMRETGLTISAIAGLTHLDRKTIRGYLNTDRFPDWLPTTRQSRVSKLAPYHDYLRTGSADGHRTVRQLWRDIQVQGYTGGLSAVATFLAHLDHPVSPPIARTLASPKPLTPRSAKMTPRRATWLLLSRPDELTQEQRQQAQQITQLHPEITQMTALAQAFVHIFRERIVDAFDSWLQHSLHSAIRELRSFARGIQRDYAAVNAALTLPWSNGMVEGQVNRLKFVKRQMFGRAHFDLLRLRILARPPTLLHQNCT
jgi:transposase